MPTDFKTYLDDLNKNASRKYSAKEILSIMPRSEFTNIPDDEEDIQGGQTQGSQDYILPKSTNSQFDNFLSKHSDRDPEILREGFNAIQERVKNRDGIRYGEPITADHLEELGRQRIETQAPPLWKEGMKSLARGVVQLPAMAGKGLQWLDPDGGSNVVENAGQAMEQFSNKYQEKFRDDIAPSKQAELSEWYSPRRMFAYGPENLVASAVPMVAGLGVGAVAGGAAGIAAGLGTLGTLFYGGSAEEKYRQAKEHGLDDDAAFTLANWEGGIEAGGEIIADLIPLGLFFKATKAVQGGVIKSIAQGEGLKGVLKTIGTTMAAETTTEVAQAAAQTAISNKMGVDVGGVGENVADVIAPTIFMSLVFGGVAGVARHQNLQQNKKAIIKTLSNPDATQEDFDTALKMVVTAASDIDKTAAKNFEQYAIKQREAGQPIVVQDDDAYTPHKQALAQWATTGQRNGEEFTPDHAYSFIREKMQTGDFTDNDLQDIKKNTPVLADVVSRIDAERVVESANQMANIWTGIENRVEQEEINQFDEEVASLASKKKEDYERVKTTKAFIEQERARVAKEKESILNSTDFKTRAARDEFLRNAPESDTYDPRIPMVSQQAGSVGEAKDLNTPDAEWFSPMMPPVRSNGLEVGEADDFIPDAEWIESYKQLTYPDKLLPTREDTDKTRGVIAERENKENEIQDKIYRSQLIEKRVYDWISREIALEDAGKAAKRDTEELARQADEYRQNLLNSIDYQSRVQNQNALTPPTETKDDWKKQQENIDAGIQSVRGSKQEQRLAQIQEEQKRLGEQFQKDHKDKIRQAEIELTTLQDKLDSGIEDEAEAVKTQKKVDRLQRFITKAQSTVETETTEEMPTIDGMRQKLQGYREREQALQTKIDNAKDDATKEHLNKNLKRVQGKIAAIEPQTPTTPDVVDSTLTDSTVRLKFKTLDDARKDFIDKKIQEIGSIEAVQAKYKDDAVVDKYARERAREIFGENTPDIVDSNPEIRENLTNQAGIVEDSKVSDVTPDIPEQRTLPDGSTIKVFKNTETNMETHIKKTAKGYSVSLWDTDANEATPTVSIYPTEEQAIEKAKEVLPTKAEQSPQPQAKEAWQMPLNEYANQFNIEQDTKKQERVSSIQNTIDNLTDADVDKIWSEAVNNKNSKTEERDEGFVIAGKTWADRLIYKNKKDAVEAILKKRLAGAKKAGYDNNHLPTLHRQAVEKALADGKLTVEEAEKLNHFKFHRDLKEKYGKPAQPQGTEKVETLWQDIVRTYANGDGTTNADGIAKNARLDTIDRGLADGRLTQEATPAFIDWLVKNGARESLKKHPLYNNAKDNETTPTTPAVKGTKFKYFDEVPPPHEIKIIPKANDAYGKQGIKFINSVLNQISKSKKQQPKITDSFIVVDSKYNIIKQTASPEEAYQTALDADLENFHIVRQNQGEKETTLDYFNGSLFGDYEITDKGVYDDKGRLSDVVKKSVISEIKKSFGISNDTEKVETPPEVNTQRAEAAEKGEVTKSNLIEKRNQAKKEILQKINNAIQIEDVTPEGYGVEEISKEDAELYDLQEGYKKTIEYARLINTINETKTLLNNKKLSVIERQIKEEYLKRKQDELEELRIQASINAKTIMEAKRNNQNQKTDAKLKGLEFAERELDYDKAYNAYYWSSFVPEKRAKETQENFVRHMNEFQDSILSQITPERYQKALLEIADYKEHYLKKYYEYLSAKAKTMSAAVTGPARFPTQKNNSAMNYERQVADELRAWAEKTQKRVKRELGIGVGDKGTASNPIMRDDPDAVDLLEKKLESLKSDHERMKKANAITRSKSISDEQKINQLIDLGYTKEQAFDLNKTLQETPYHLTNNNANIKRIEDRISELKAQAQDTTSEYPFEGGKIVDNVEAVRVQIVYDGKPDEETRTKLKSKGFRWSPNNKAWQRQRTRQALWDAQNITGVKAKPAPDAKFSKGVKPSTPASLDELPRRQRKIADSLIKKGTLNPLTNTQALNLLQQSGEALYSAAWHGSPHDHDGFDMSKIGSGEGNQAYGYGLYFAESKDVAEYYRTAGHIPSPYININGRKIGLAHLNHKDGFEKTAAYELIDAKGNYSLARMRIENNYDKPSKYLKALDTLKKQGAMYESDEILGKLYKVDLAPNEDEYLLWDKPFNEQSENVKQVILEHLDNLTNMESDYKKASEYASDKYRNDFLNKEGSGLYKEIETRFGSDKAASEYLLSLGIRGIKYLDGTSRGKGKGNYNYVIFNDKDVTIEAKYSKDGLIQAFVLNGKAYIVPENIESGKMWNVIRHDVGTHIGQLLQNDHEFNRLKNRVKLRRDEQSPTGEAIRKAYSRAEAADTKPEFMEEEVLGYLVEDSPNVSIARKLIALIKKYLAKIGINYDLTQADMVALADIAVRREVNRRDKNRQQGGAKFAKAEGKPLNTDTTAFSAWFKDSKVVDKDGLPLKVYHGTDADFNIFEDNPNYYQRVESGGFFFSDNKNITQGYGDNVKPVFLSIQDPVIFDFEGKSTIFFNGKHRTPSQLVQEIKNIRYDLENRYSLDDELIDELDVLGWSSSYADTIDGIIMHNIDDTDSLLSNKKDIKQTNYVAFEPTQIKSVFNQGTFDPTNPDIRFSIAPPAAQAQPFSIPDKMNLLDSFKDNYVNQLMSVKKAQDAMGGVSPEADLFTKESLRLAKAADEIKDGIDRHINPMLKLMADSKFTIDNVNEYVYSRHAPEANERLKYTTAKEWLLRLAKIRNDGEIEEAIETIEKNYNDAVKKLNKLIKKQSKADVEEEIQELELWLKDNEPKNAFFDELITQFAPDKIDGEKEIKLHNKWLEFIEKPSGMTNDEAQKLQDKWKKHPNYKQMKKIAEYFDAMNREKLKISYHAGRMTKNEYAAISKTFQYYAPLHREGFEDSVSGYGSGLRNLGKDTMARGGSILRAVDMLQYAINDYQLTILKAHKAESTRAFKNFVDSLPEGSNFIEYVEAPTKAEYDRSGNIKHVLSHNLQPNEVDFKVDGVLYIARANPNNEYARRIIEQIKFNPEKTGVLVKALSKFNRVLAMVNTSLSPEFLFTNFIKDLEAASINLQATEISNMTKQVVKDLPMVMKGLHNYMRGNKSHKLTPIIKRYFASGASVGWLDSIGTIEEKTQKLQDELDKFKPLSEVQGNKQKVKIASKKLWDRTGAILMDYNSVVENALRVSAFKAALDAGVSEEQAAMLAKNLTVNFNAKGLHGQVMNSLYLFSNAGIQGSAKVISVLMKSKKARQIIGASVGLSVGLAIANSMIGGDDDDGVSYYEKIDDFQKQRNIIFMLPNGKGKYVSIPLPWGYNVFWKLGEEVGTAIATWDRYKPLDGVSRMITTTLNAFNPLQSGTLLQTVTPTILDPLASWGENKNWSGSPLMPEQNQFSKYPEPNSQRFFPSARKLSVDIAQGLNSLTGGNEIKSGLVDISPETLDLVWDTFTGSAGKFVANTVNVPVKMLAGEERSNREIPFYRRFVGEKSEYVDEQIFRKNVSHIYQLHDQAEKYPERAREFKKDKAYYLLNNLQAVEKRLRRLYKKRKALTAKEDIDRIQETINNTKMKFNTLYNKSF